MKPFYTLLRLVAVVITLAGVAHAHEIHSKQAGAWSDPATWHGDQVPNGHDAVISHRVVMGAGWNQTGRVLIEHDGALVMDNEAGLIVKDASLVNLGRLDMGYAWLHFDVSSNEGYRGRRQPRQPGRPHLRRWRLLRSNHAV